MLAVDYGVEAESIDLNGKKVADLGHSVIRKAQPTQTDSSMLLVFDDEDEEKVALADARTGTLTRYSFPMNGTPMRWVFDKRGDLRAVTLKNSEFWKDVTKIANWYKPSANAEWLKLAEFDVSDDYWLPIYVPDQENTLIISSSVGRNTSAIFQYNTTKNAIGDMMAGAVNQDILGVAGLNLTEFNYVTTSGMIPQQFWFDAEWQKLQDSVDGALPAHINTLSGNPAGRLLVYSYSDVDPGQWYLFDTEQLKLRKIASARPAIDPIKMRPMRPFSYPAKDGLMIPAYLTRPSKADGPAPTVVMVHGGPTVRDRWEWNPDVQLLAAHGYVVLQPQFRGSSGFGRAFEAAGYGQWGLAMQDDITAGVEYLIQQGIADPARTCIYGASYGGYAALYGLVKTPKLYRCGVSFAGVSDIAYMFSDSSDSTQNKVARQLARTRIGDPKLNKEQFDQVSPLLHADRIEAPILLMHGKDDQRVPISHMEKMRKALDDHRKPYDWRVFKGEGHGLTYVSNQKIFYETLLDFLKKNMAAGLPPTLSTSSP